MRRSTARLVLLTLLAAGAASAWAQTGTSSETTGEATTTAAPPAAPLTPAEFATRDAILIPLPNLDGTVTTTSPAATSTATSAPAISAPRAPAALAGPVAAPASPAPTTTAAAASAPDDAVLATEIPLPPAAGTPAGATTPAAAAPSAPAAPAAVSSAGTAQSSPEPLPPTARATPGAEPAVPPLAAAAPAARDAEIAAAAEPAVEQQLTTAPAPAAPARPMATAPSATAPSATAPPVTDPPATDPPATGPPVTDPPATDPSATGPATTTGTMPAAPAGPPALRLALQPLYADSGGDVLLQGEEPSASFVVPVPQGIGAGSARLEIVYRSGIDMLPEQSKLTLSIDGQPVDEIEPTAFSDAKTWSVPVTLTGEPQLAITIAARQSHRLLCGPQASYELWTAIDLTRSALVVDMPAALFPATVDEALAALQLNIASGAAVTLVPTGAVDDPVQLKPLVDAAQALGLRADRIPLRVVVAPTGQIPADDPASALPPAVLLVGTATDVGRLVPAFSVPSVNGPTLTLAAPPGGGPSALIATGRTPDEVLAAVRRIAPDGATAAASGTVLTEGGTYPLTRFGLTDRDVRAHRERIDIDFRLPSDLYAADGTPVRFLLDAAYAPALEDGAALTMTVNGISTGIVRLSQASGEFLRRREIDLPFRLFRPGDNRVSVELAIPVATPDRPCPPMTEKDDPLFTLFASSSLTFPPFAHLQELPDLRLFSDGGTPYSGDGAVDFVMPAPDAQSLSAAATVAARLAAAAGRPLHLEPAVAWPRTSSRDKIVVAPVDALADDMLGGADLRRRDLIAALPLATDLAPTDDTSGEKSVESLVERITAERRAVEPSIPGQTPAGSATAAPAPATDDSAERQSAWEARLDAAEEPSWYDRILPDIQGIVADVEARITDEAQGETAAQFLSRIGAVPGGIILQYPAIQSTGSAVTVLTAADPASLARAATDLAGNAVWPQLRGDLVAFGGAVTTPAYHMPIRTWNAVTDPLSAESVVRLAPHWLSKHTAIWLGLVLGLALLAAIVTRLLLNRIGVRDAS